MANPDFRRPVDDDDDAEEVLPVRGRTLRVRRGKPDAVQLGVLLAVDLDEQFRRQVHRRRLTIEDAVAQALRGWMAAKPAAAKPEDSVPPAPAADWFRYEIQTHRNEYLYVVAQRVSTHSLGETSFVRLRFPYKGPGKSKPRIVERSFNTDLICSIEAAMAPDDDTKTTYLRGSRLKIVKKGLKRSKPLRAAATNLNGGFEFDPVQFASAIMGATNT